MSLSELAVIFLVALVVLKPEQVPDIARALGRLLQRAKSMSNDIKQEMNQHMHLAEKEQLAQAADKIYQKNQAKPQTSE